MYDMVIMACAGVWLRVAPAGSRTYPLAPDGTLSRLCRRGKDRTPQGLAYAWRMPTDASHACCIMAARRAGEACSMHGCMQALTLSGWCTLHSLTNASLT
jgi:hypothetical protein